MAAKDKISDLEISKVSTSFKFDKEMGRIVETTITFKTYSLAPEQASRLQQLGTIGRVEITVAPQMSVAEPKAADG